MQRRNLKAVIDIIHFSRRAGNAGQNGADTPFSKDLFLIPRFTPWLMRVVTFAACCHAS
jgi:hypothetical protein